MLHLFEPFNQRSANLPNRIAVSPICQDSSENGFAHKYG